MISIALFLSGFVTGVVALLISSFLFLPTPPARVYIAIPKPPQDPNAPWETDGDEWKRGDRS